LFFFIIIFFPNKDFKLPLPTLVYSDFDEDFGVMVLEDWAPDRYRLDQPDLMRLVDPGMQRGRLHRLV
jgi:hypothetical protein